MLSSRNIITHNNKPNMIGYKVWNMDEWNSVNMRVVEIEAKVFPCLLMFAKIAPLNKISSTVSKVFSFSRHLSCRNDSLWEVASALLRHTFGVESLRDCHFFARMGKNMKPSGFASCTVRCASWHIVPLHTA